MMVFVTNQIPASFNVYAFYKLSDVTIYMKKINCNYNIRACLSFNGFYITFKM
jgi:hypothetical protein